MNQSPSEGHIHSDTHMATAGNTHSASAKVHPNQDDDIQEEQKQPPKRMLTTQESNLTPGEEKPVDPIQKLIEVAKEKIKKDQEATKAASDAVPYSKILLTYADGTDKVLMGFGYFFAIVTGLGIPSFTFLFGDIVVNFTDPTKSIADQINPLALQLTIIGGVMFVTSYLYFVFLVIMAERIAKKTRVAYLRSILRQEIAWFDSSITITELSSRLSKECQAI